MEKYRHKRKAKMNIPIRVAAVLLCLTLVSTYFVSGMFARYATSGQSSGNARVAKFSIEGSGISSQYLDASLSPGTDKDVPLIIENNSEVAVEYTVVVTNVTNNLPLSFRMEKKGASPTVRAGGTTSDSTTFTVLQSPDSHGEYTLFINWQAQDGDIDRIGMVDYIKVTVTAVQTD